MSVEKPIIFRGSILFLSAWTGLLLWVYAVSGVDWFLPGDFGFHTAMAYHGLLIPAWMMIVLAYVRYTECSGFMRKFIRTGVVLGGFLTGLGALFIYGEGLSFWTVVQVTGMVIAEITALVIIVISFVYYFKSSRKGINAFAWWTVTLALIGMSLATPAGHLAGAIKDLGTAFPSWFSHPWLSQNVAGNYIDAHSHQMLAAFLAAGFAMPLLRTDSGKSKGMVLLQNSGLVIMMIATLAQISIYQYCAWSGWEPPVLFSSGLNGIPLDDAVLSALGFGMLLLVPGLWIKNKKGVRQDNNDLFLHRMVAVFILVYLMAVVGLGLYIEFHEQFFGQATGNAPGVANDLAFIRGHLLFGFMIIPLLLGTFLHGNMISERKQKDLMVILGLFVVLTGLSGIFLWTFFLNVLMMKIAVLLTVVFLLAYAFILSRKTSKNIRLQH